MNDLHHHEYGQSGEAPQPSQPPLASPSETEPAAEVPNERAAALRRVKARRNVTLIIIGALVAGAVGWYLEETASLPFAKIASFTSAVTNDVQKGFANYPGPLKGNGGVPLKNATLDIQGVIADTNNARTLNGNLSGLTENDQLDAIATLRLDDMFERQYFAHVSPQGQSATTVASSVGYNHLALGENLAMGLFAGDQGVVDAWMQSPGHRANILDTHYTEIGIAVRKGTFNGQTTWIAVQIFGKPTSACPPLPDPNLQKAIDVAESTISSTARNLDQLRIEIQGMQPQSGAEYNAKVQQYNTLADQYNQLVNQTKTEVSTYNASVAAYNACL